LQDPRLRPAQRVADAEMARAGRRAGLTLAAVGVLWILATAISEAQGWPTRTRALFDLLALAGFGWALYLTWQVWRLRRADRG
jgi:threonine/homoserine/homoserine lactone efflux protein